MNQEIEYAEMLEIPVSTVNVVKKPRRRKKTRTTVPILSPEQNEAENFSDDRELKDSVIAQVNDKLTEPLNDEAAILQADGAFTEEGRLDFDVPDRVDTVRLYPANQRKRGFFHSKKKKTTFAFSDEYAPITPDFSENDGGRYELNAEAFTETNAQKITRIALNAEFALACALCGAIFLTNVFMPNSAINTFFRSMNNPTVEEVDARDYNDFTLSPIVSELSDTLLTLSPSGVLTFQDECCVYPAADGTVSEIIRAENGTYLVKISHSDTFTGVIDGLDYVYYEVGDDIYANVPVGFSKGESEVQVTMYSEGELLSCLRITEENCLAWVEEV